MNNNDVIRRLRYIFNMNDTRVIRLFADGGLEVNPKQVTDWLRKDDDEEFQAIYDKQLASFLNGFIIEKRGRREGLQPKPEKTLSNNLILLKIKIALNMRSEDILDILQLADLKVSKHELSALFRKPGQRQYRLCKDQFLRNFLMGLQLKYQ